VAVFEKASAIFRIANSNLLASGLKIQKSCDKNFNRKIMCQDQS